MHLFPALRVSANSRRPIRRHRSMQMPGLRAGTSPPRQLEFLFVLRELTRHDLDTPFDFPTHSRVDAHAAPRLEVRAPRSVFDLGAFGPVAVRLNQAPEQSVRVRIVRDSGAVRCERIAVQDTPEYHEAERARRARQKPPKGRQIGWKKTRSDKLRGMIREETED